MLTKLNAANFYATPPRATQDTHSVPNMFLGTKTTSPSISWFSDMSIRSTVTVRSIRVARRALKVMVGSDQEEVLHAVPGG